eukprot:gene8890-9840_t
MLEQLQNLDPKKGSPQNAIPAKILKYNADLFCFPLTELFNKLVEESSFPDNMKNADVSSLFKKDDNMSKKNYRPISLLPTIGKIFERLMHRATNSKLNRIQERALRLSFLGEEISHRNLPETVSRDIEWCDKAFDSNISPTRSLTRTLSTKASVEIFFENNEYKIKNAESNPFCEDCVKSLKQFGLENPFKLRQVIETYKLKVIQDMNTFKRLLKQAETNYYALFREPFLKFSSSAQTVEAARRLRVLGRSYSFLISSDNGDILLKNAEVQCEDGSDKGSKNVLDILQKYIEGKQGFSSIRNDDKSYLKTQYLLRLLNN